MNGFERLCQAYGLPLEIAGQIPCPPVENGQIQCKIAIIDAAEHMKKELDWLIDYIRRAPVDGDEYRLQLMKQMYQTTRRAMIDVCSIHEII